MRAAGVMWRVGLLILLVGLTAPALAQRPVPALEARVTDLTDTLTAAQITALEQRLAQLEQRKGSQVAVLLVSSTRPETIEQFGIRVAEQWALGRAGVDDGVLLLVATEDRTVRIEVGYGLEGVLPDAVAKRIIAETIVPRFRAGDFHGGIVAAVARIERVIEGEPLPPPEAEGAPQHRGPGDALGIALVGTLVLGGLLRGLFGRLIGALLVGGLMGLIFWLLAASLAGAILVGILAFVFTLLGGAAGPGGYYGGRGGFGGGLGGGGFRGGGGGFGGGGASGRW